MSTNKKELSSFGNCGNSESMSGKLEHREEICLSAFVDGECGWLKKIFARRVLRNNFEARRFVDELERTSSQIHDSYGTELKALSDEISLWPRISARIAQEERLTLLRSIPVESTDLFSWAGRLSWSAFGAVAASALFLIYLPIATSHKNVELANAKNSLMQLSNVSNSSLEANKIDVSQIVDSPRFIEAAPQVSNVSEGGFEGPTKLSREDYKSLEMAALQGSQLLKDNHSQDPYAWKFIQQEPQLIDNDGSRGLSLRNERKVIAPQVFEVDWVRSNGRVKLLQDPRGNAPMLWVNRPQQARSPILVQAGNR